MVQVKEPQVLQRRHPGWVDDLQKVVVEVQDPEPAEPGKSLRRDGADLVVTEPELDEGQEVRERLVVQRAQDVVAQVQGLQGPGPGKSVEVERRDEVVAQVQLLELGLGLELVLPEGVELVVRQVQDLQVLVDVEGTFESADLVSARVQLLRSRVQKNRHDVQLALGAVRLEVALVALALARAEARTKINETRHHQDNDKKCRCSEPHFSGRFL